jgi:uncharacterized alpha-E superfamily protein
MLARIADSMFWMSRYIERSDGIMRMLKVNYTASLDKSSGNAFTWRPVLQLFTFLNEEECKRIEFDTKAVMEYMITDKSNDNSLVNIITRSRENARGVQDHLTLEVWGCINDFYHLVRAEKIQAFIRKGEVIQVLDELMKQDLLFYGTADITMPREQGWWFMNIGKSIERALQTVDLLNVKFSDLSYDFNTPADTPYWKYLLMSASGYELYVKTYRSGLKGENVIQQMVLNEDFPRSILYSIQEVCHYFKNLRSDRNLENFNKVNFLIGKLKSKVEYSNLESISTQGLKHYLEEIRSDLNGITNALNTFYFAQQ